MPKSKPNPVAPTAFTYKNRRGQIYFLYAGKTKRGNATYFFSMKPGPEALSAVPEGYEVYEKPGGQVFLRKPPKQLIHEAELEIIRRELAKFPKCRGTMLEIKKKVATLHVPDHEGVDAIHEHFTFLRLNESRL